MCLTLEGDTSCFFVSCVCTGTYFRKTETVLRMPSIHHRLLSQLLTYLHYYCIP